MQRTQIGDALVEHDPAATRELYAKTEGSITSCDCVYCENYRRVREQIYPADFREILERLGIDYRKETELTHLPRDDEDNECAFGHRCYGHYAFVGRVIEDPAQCTTEAPSSGFSYDIAGGASVHPVTRATFGNSADFIDLRFWVSSVPEA